MNYWAENYRNSWETYVTFERKIFMKLMKDSLSAAVKLLVFCIHENMLLLFTKVKEKKHTIYFKNCNLSSYQHIDMYTYKHKLKTCKQRNTYVSLLKTEADDITSISYYNIYHVSRELVDKNQNPFPIRSFR